MNKEIYEMNDKTFKTQVEYLSEMLDAKDILDIPVRKLSLGQRMKCELLAALLHKPEVVFLDEPTIGLDIVVQRNSNFFLI
ncbi:MAG: ATP-binding cassette domain-containing protein [Candidatus Dojkabacteria bacterium]|nr:ATP-binding cassette domain-containing protein [Candidatus Dojkabacteria bacterium]